MNQKNESESACVRGRGVHRSAGAGLEAEARESATVSNRRLTPEDSLALISNAAPRQLFAGSNESGIQKPGENLPGGVTSDGAEGRPPSSFV